MDRSPGTGGSIEGIVHQYADSTNLAARMTIHDRFGSGAIRWQSWVFDQLMLKPAEAVIEVGCGPGTLWRENRDRMPGCPLALTDMSRGMAAEARRALNPGAGLSVETLVADVQDLPFSGATFDVAIANHMLYHVADIDLALSELRRVLRPDGRLVAATNGAAHMEEVTALMGRHLHLTGAGMVVTEFTLESGAAALGRHFRAVDLIRAPSDPLRVTDVAPLVGYARSTGHYAEGSAAQWDALEREVAAVIAREGHFFVTRAAGIFVCRP